MSADLLLALGVVATVVLIALLASAHSPIPYVPPDLKGTARPMEGKSNGKDSK